VAAARLQRLVWDTRFFGFPVFELQTDRLRFTDTARLLARAKQKNVRCLYYIGPASATDRRLARRLGFRFQADRHTFAAPVPKRSLSPVLNVRPACAADQPRLISIVKEIARHSRFSRDRRFPAGSADRLYVEWLKRSMRGRFDDAVLIVLDNGKPAGLVSLRQQPARQGQIGLIGVAQGSRGRGLGQRLMQAAIRWFQTKGIRRIQVITQGDNKAAHALYRSSGFRRVSMQAWHHRWFPA